MNTTKQIYEAYLQVVNEAGTPKFKVGDHVGIGAYTYNGYAGHDTGTVTKINKFGHHTVEFHNRKSSDDSSKPLVKQFDAGGSSRDKYSDHVIVPKAEHEEVVKTNIVKNERNKDLREVATHLNNHQITGGSFTKLSPSAAKRMKELIDKHTAAEE